MTSTDPMKNNGLLLGKNEVGMGWCLERLRATAQSRPNARDLAILQSVPLYYLSLSVKREVKMPSAKRHIESAKAYKFSAKAYLAYLMEQHEFRTPEWLTQGMMGRRTLTAKREPSLKTFGTPSTTAAGLLSCGIQLRKVQRPAKDVLRVGFEIVYAFAPHKK